MQSGVIIMTAFTRLFFIIILFFTYGNVAPVLFFLNESNIKSTERLMGRGDEY